MPYLVDGCNLIGFLPGFALSRDGDEGRLLQTLLRSPEIRRRGLVLVFDGVPSHGARRKRLSAKVEIRHSGPKQDADTLIRHLMDKADPQHYILVTDDREIRDYARMLKVRNIPCVELARMLPRKGSGGSPEEAHPFDKSSSRPLSDNEMQDWLEWFGTTEEPDQD